MEYITTFILEFITLFSEMAPFLLLGFLLAGILHVWVPNQVYVPKISKPNFASVLWASLFGVPLPICSCGVIPTSIALRREGASKGASVSFLISTPATGVDSILATYSFASYLSTNREYSGWMSFSFSHCSFSLKVRGLSIFLAWTSVCHSASDRCFCDCYVWRCADKFCNAQ